jgi:hypothetical protein
MNWWERFGFTEKPTKWEHPHEPWCAFQISVNNEGPIFNRCDCIPKVKKLRPMPLFDSRSGDRKGEQSNGLEEIP